MKERLQGTGRLILLCYTLHPFNINAYKTHEDREVPEYQFENVFDILGCWRCFRLAHSSCRFEGA
jgi:hypothetical protein